MPTGIIAVLPGLVGFTVLTTAVGGTDVHPVVSGASTRTVSLTTVAPQVLSATYGAISAIAP